MFKTPLTVTLVSPRKGLWRTHCPLQYSGHTDEFCVPSGFLTDFTSVPRAFRWAVSVVGPQVRAAVLHDYLYSENTPVSRRDADRLFLRAMQADGVSFWRRQLIYRAVRLFGNPSYVGNPSPN